MTAMVTGREQHRGFAYRNGEDVNFNGNSDPNMGYAYVPPGCFLFGSTDEETVRRGVRARRHSVPRAS